MDSFFFYFFFGVCFICFTLRTLYAVLENKESKLAGNNNISKILLVVMFFLWFSWFGMSFHDQYEMNLPTSIRYGGLIFFIVGFATFAVSHLNIKGVKSDKLAKRGIYLKIRHPMYYGFIIWMIGLPIFMNALFTLTSAIIWIPQILYWRTAEERQMEKKYNDYQEYKEKTWF